MRSTTSHSMYESAVVTTAHPLPSAIVTSMSPNLFSPGENGFKSAFMVSFSSPCRNTFRLKQDPFKRNDSTARSFATATVKQGGLNEACDTHDANIALCASPFLAVTAQSDPTIRPTALATSLAPAAAPPCAICFVVLLCFFLRVFFTACAKSVPLSSQSWSIASVGLNLHRTASNPKVNPPSFSRLSIKSTASPDHPKLPKTPLG
mmetsp:Transcript_3556/g.13123  ORF Transcript_3556/g.13123 Transcript_3556/m.13123 type:complete len:206 (+) Transcript_3556:179-796(+)